MPLRILHCIHSVNPAGGGPIEGIKQLSAVNARCGDTVEIVSLDSPEEGWVKDCPIKVHPMGPGWLSYGFSSRLHPWLVANHHRFDLVVVNGIWQYNAFGTWRALRKSSTPYVVFTHGMLDPWFKKTYPRKHVKKWLYWQCAEYRVLRDAAAVLFTCEEERRLARQSFGRYRVTERVVKYGTVGPGEFDVQRGRRLARELWPSTAGKRCILHLGRVHEKKGTDLVLSAFAEFLREMNPDTAAQWHLLLAGPTDHAYGRAMQQRATALGLDPHVTWTGMLTGESKWSAYHHSEAFLLPSHQENFGIVVAESLACGKPVLISDKVNIWREIDGHGAAFVDSDDHHGALRLLRRWRDTAEQERLEMGQRALNCFQAEFQIEAGAASFISAVNEVLSHRRVRADGLSRAA